MEIGRLILTRRLNERVFIGSNNEIEILVGGIQGNQVRLIISADKSVPIRRDDIKTKRRD